MYVHLHEARDMRSSSDPAKRHKFPEPVFTVQASLLLLLSSLTHLPLPLSSLSLPHPSPYTPPQTCGKKEHTKRKKKCQACLLNQLFIFDFEQKDTYDMDLEKVAACAAAQGLGFGVLTLLQVTVQLSNSKGFTDDLVAGDG